MSGDLLPLLPPAAKFLPPSAPSSPSTSAAPDTKATLGDTFQNRHATADLCKSAYFIAKILIVLKAFSPLLSPLLYPVAPPIASRSNQIPFSPQSRPRSLLTGMIAFHWDRPGSRCFSRSPVSFPPFPGSNLYVLLSFCDDILFGYRHPALICR